MSKQETKTHLKRALNKLRDGDVSNVEVGTLIRTWRQVRELKQGDLAESLGLCKSFVCEIEHGKRGMSIATRKRLQEIVG